MAYPLYKCRHCGLENPDRTLFQTEGNEWSCNICRNNYLWAKCEGLPNPLPKQIITDTKGATNEP